MTTDCLSSHTATWLGAGARERRRDLAAPHAGAHHGASTSPQVRENVAVIDVFDAHVGQTHPKVAHAHPTVCELQEGEALFLPKVSARDGASDCLV